MVEPARLLRDVGAAPDEPVRPLREGPVLRRRHHLRQRHERIPAGGELAEDEVAPLPRFPLGLERAAMLNPGFATSEAEADDPAWPVLLRLTTADARRT